MYELNYVKFLSVAKSIMESGLVGREFTKKEFDAIFKGTRKNPSEISLNWLRENGSQNGQIAYCRSWNKNKVKPFVKCVRVEVFELPLDKESSDYGKMIEKVVKKSNGETVNCNVDLFEKEEFYREGVNSKFGECSLIETEKTTFIAHRNFYEIDVEAMNSIDVDTIRVKLFDRYSRKLEEINREKARLEKLVESFS